MTLVEKSINLDVSEMNREAGDERRIVLLEWSTKRLRLDDDVARRLGETPWISVTTDREVGWWKVSTRQWVGAFTLGDLRIIVRPKIKPENLFLLLEVGLPPEAWRAEAIDYATNDELLPALVSFFARTAETTLARGLFHHYRHEEDDLLALRGRINFTRQFRRGGVLVPMACSWDDFTADVDENRCLTAAIGLALRVPDVPHEDRRRLRRLFAALDGVTELTPAAALDRLDRIWYTRLNEHYKPALRLARLILANCTLQDQHGDTAASAFMVDMNELFERFVTSRLRRELRGKLNVDAQRVTHLDTDRRVQIRPDLTFRRYGTEVGVADLKYKLLAGTDINKTDSSDASQMDASQTDISQMDGASALMHQGNPSTNGTGAARARQGDYYQVLAYTTALGLCEGTLIYCADVNRDDSAWPNNSTRPGQRSSNAAEFDTQQRSAAELAVSRITVKHLGTKLHTVAIDLSGSPSDINAQITALAEHLEATTTASQSRASQSQTTVTVSTH